MPKASTFGALLSSQVIESDSVPLLTNAGDNKRVAISEMRNVVGPGWSLTINAANESGATDELKIQAAITHANGIGGRWVTVPSSMIPFDAGLVTFVNTVQMVVEGGDWNRWDVRGYGVAGDSDAGRATSNSIGIQAAVDGADAFGGGKVYFPSSLQYYCTDAPIIVPAGVSIVGDDRYSSIVQKVTNTASTITDPTVPQYQTPTAVGFPICVFHFREGAGVGWSYGTVENLSVYGSTTDPNTSVVDYGFFFHGISNGTVRNTQALYCKVGYFFGTASTIMSEISGNISFKCHRGFYQYYMTGSKYDHNFVIHGRYSGHDISAYYSNIFANGCDSGASTLSGRAASTELFIAYKLYACVGTICEANGCEVNNGTALWMKGCLSTAVRNNAFLTLTSDHTGSNLYALDVEANVDCTIEDNRFVWDTTKLFGSASAPEHFNWRLTGNVGYLIFARNRFLDNLADVVDAGWTNTSGSVVHSAGILDLYQEGTFTPTFTGLTIVLGAGSVSYTGSYTRIGRQVFVEINVIPIDGATVQSVAGTSVCDNLPYTVSRKSASLHASDNAVASLGNGIFYDAHNGYTPAWSAHSNTVHVSGVYTTND